MRACIRLYVFLFLILFSNKVYAQSAPLDFNLVNGANGVTLGQINSITQDTSGFMWFADQQNRCIVRFDGYQMKRYAQDPLNNNSPGGTQMECITSDHSGNVWFTNENGVDKFNPAINKFTHFFFPGKKHGDLYALIVDHFGIVWIGTSEGLWRLDPKTGKFIYYSNKADDPTSLSSNMIRVLYEDHEGVLWIGTGWPFFGSVHDTIGGGLNKFERKTGTFTRYMHDPDNPHSLTNNKVRAIFEDSRGVFWVGTQGDGLHIMNRKTGTFQRLTYDPTHPGKLSRPPIAKGDAWDHITFITEDGAGTIWIGTWSGGLVRYNPFTNETTRLRAESRSGGFNDSTAWCAYTSHDGVVWISTERANLYRIDPLQSSFFKVDLGDQAMDFFEDSSGIIWIALENNGLLRFDLHRNDRKIFTHDPSDPASITNNRVTKILPASNGTLWVGTWNGLNLFDPRTGRATRYLYDETDQNDTCVFAMFNDQNKELYLGTRTGFYIMNMQAGAFTRYAHDPADSTTISGDIVLELGKDKFGNVWVGNWRGNGLNLFESKTNRFKHFFEGLTIGGITTDSEGKIWVGTSSGLFHQTNSHEFSPVGEEGSALRARSFGKFIQDDKKNIWGIISQGIFRFNPSTNEICIYGKKFGINPSEFGGAAYRAKNGELLFSQPGGYCVSSPRQLINSTPPRPVLTDFKINGHSVDFAENNSPLKMSVEQTKEIKLNYRQNIFSLSFDPIHYSSPADNICYFMMQGYDNTWRKADSTRSVNYFNMQPHSYIFRIKAQNSYGVWGETDVKIIVYPPWYRTWLAYTIYLLLLIIAVWVFVRWRTQRLKKEKIVLEQKVALRTQELKKEKEIVESTLAELKSTQAQLIQSEKMASLGQLTAGIAHEIQNPLNFVNNFSEVSNELMEELIDERSKKDGEKDQELQDELLNDIKQNLEKITQHGKRAGAIVRSMLEHSKPSAGKKELTNINALVDEYLRLAYHGMRAKDKNFNVTLHTDFDPDLSPIDARINVVPQDIGRVLLNLYNNAFYAISEKKKQLGESYEPTISVSTKLISPLPGGLREAEIRVSDNGNGIPKNIVDKIFQPFFTTKPTGHGTGLGLSLSYDIIKAHGGEINVETEEGGGAEFIIHLP